MESKIELELLTTKCLPDVILLFETRIIKNIEECKLKTKNYSHIVCPSLFRQTGVTCGFDSRQRIIEAEIELLRTQKLFL